jgi:HEAT repeat protein
VLFSKFKVHLIFLNLLNKIEFMSIYSGLENFDINKLIEKWNSLPIIPEESELYYQEIAFLIREKGDTGNQFITNFLLDKRNLDDLDRIQAVLRFPPLSKNKSVSEFLIQCLEDHRPKIISLSIDALSCIQNSSAFERILPFKSHENPYVRGSVLRYLSKLYPDTAYPLLIESLQDSHYIVRENAIDELDEMCDIKATPYIKALMNDAHPHVRQAAKTAFENLSNLSLEND